jgi:hypothetical protein
MPSSEVTGSIRVAVAYRLFNSIKAMDSIEMRKKSALRPTGAEWHDNSILEKLE